MLENLAPVLKPGVTDLLLNSSGTFTHRQFGRWVVNPDPDAVNQLLTGAVADLSAEVPEIQQGLGAGRDFDFRHVVTVGEHRMRVLGSARKIASGSWLELSIRVHPLVSPVKASELTPIVRAISERRSGLFIVTGSFGKTTYLNALAQLCLKSNDKRVVVVEKLQELELHSSGVPLHHIAGEFSKENAAKAKALSADVIVVLDDAADADVKHRLAVLATQSVVIASAPGGDTTSALMSWAEQHDVSSALLANVFAGSLAVNLQAESNRWRPKLEKYLCAADEGDTLLFRNNLAGKNWKMIQRMFGSGVSEVRRDVA